MNLVYYSASVRLWPIMKSLCLKLLVCCGDWRGGDSVLVLTGARGAQSSAVESKHNRLLITLMTREYVSRCHEGVMCHWCCYHVFAAVWATQQRAFLPTAVQYHQITTRNYPNCENFSSCHFISHFELETLVQLKKWLQHAAWTVALIYENSVWVCWELHLVHSLGWNSCSCCQF